MLDGLVAKYLDILGISALPAIKVVDRLGDCALGRCKWNPRQPGTTTIELQKKLFGDSRTLERVLAHELVHHWDYLDYEPRALAMIRAGNLPKPLSHGPTWRRGAAAINDVMGADFVTEYSDQTFVCKNTKPLFLLIKKVGSSWEYSWAAKLSAVAKARVSEELHRGARLVTTTDDRWTKSPYKIGKIIRYAAATAVNERAPLLKQLYESAV